MYEMNKSLSENLAAFLMGFREEVVKALLSYSFIEE